MKPTILRPHEVRALAANGRVQIRRRFKSPKPLDDKEPISVHPDGAGGWISWYGQTPISATESLRAIGVNPFEYGDICRDDETKYQASYRALWESIYGPGSWDANPLVWVVDARRVEA